MLLLAVGVYPSRSRLLYSGHEIQSTSGAGNCPSNTWLVLCNWSEICLTCRPSPILGAAVLLLLVVGVYSSRSRLLYPGQCCWSLSL